MQRVTYVPWDEWFGLWPRRWTQGQHVTMIGPTGVGKTTLATKLVEPRAFVAAFGTKPEDETLAKLLKEGWLRIEKWPPPEGKERIVLWPRIKDPKDTFKVQQRIFSDALMGIYKQKRWCVWIDELLYMTNMLKLRTTMQMYYTHARSLKISLLGATQRPAWVPLEAYSQAGHLIIWRTGHEDDLKKLGGLNGVSAKEIIGILQQLDYREFLHVDLVRQRLAVSRLTMRGR